MRPDMPWREPIRGVSTALRVAAAPLVAAAPAALAEPAAVQVTGERSFLNGCTRLGDVEGSSLMGIIIENEGWQNAVDEMKERALALGATHLLLVRVDRGITGSRGFGEAYACPPQPDAPPHRGGRRR